MTTAHCVFTVVENTRHSRSLTQYFGTGWIHPNDHLFGKYSLSLKCFKHSRPTRSCVFFYSECIRNGNIWMVTKKSTLAGQFSLPYMLQNPIEKKHNYRRLLIVVICRNKKHSTINFGPSSSHLQQYIFVSPQP